MQIIVVGSAAGGGFPQWNCRTEYCRLARDGSSLTQSRTQSSLAVASEGKDWVLLNCSPDLRQQVNQTPLLHPRNGLRGSPIKAVVLTNGDIDHIAGLLTMRESEPFCIYASDRVERILETNTVFNVLNPDFVKRNTFALEHPFELHAPQGQSLGLEIEPFAVPGKVALFMEDASQGADFGTHAEDTVGLRVKDLHNNTSFYYIPGCAAVAAEIRRRLDGADLVFFDGTLFHDDEMVTMGVGHKTGKRMGHISMHGAHGSLEAFRSIDVKRKIYIHINNTNPVLLNNSRARQIVESAGWEVAVDGMVVEL